MPTLNQATSPYAGQRARAELRRMRERMAALQTQQADLAKIAADAAPVKDTAAWPTDIRELAEKIYREDNRGLRSCESPVRDRDRQLVLAGLPPGVEVQRNDPRYS